MSLLQNRSALVEEMVDGEIQDRITCTNGGGVWLCRFIHWFNSWRVMTFDSSKLSRVSMSLIWSENHQHSPIPSWLRVISFHFHPKRSETV